MIDNNNNNNETNKNDKNDNKFNIGIFDPDGINLNPLNSLEYSSEFKNLAKFWSNLPAYKMAKQIVESIESNDIILVKSCTGSGKTVLIPPFALHANNYSGKIIVTLPKKIITKKAAEFAAKILDVKLGEQIGYQFRGENLKSNKTILLYSTDGSIISMIKSDPMLKSIDIIIIDEAHERKVNIDLLLYLLKNSIKMRKDKKLKPLKLIIMSATINESLFQSYYSDYNFEWMELAGTPNYSIKSIYLESALEIKSNQYLEKGMEIIGEIIQKINLREKDFNEGDILFFVCTISECNDLAEKLGSKYPDCFTMGLYSGFDSELEPYISNPEKFKELNPKFKRRLFVSTNVAESSLTIDGIVYVIDSGLELNVSFNPETNTNIMQKKFITQAQMTQRKGRAGRTKPGVCYHLYTPQIQESSLKFPLPEIRSIDLKNTCLSLMKMCSNISNLKTDSKTDSKTDTKADTKTDTKTDSKADSKTDSKTDTKADTKTDTKADTKTDTKTDTKVYCDISKTIDMFTHFIEPPGEKFITNGFDFAITNGLIGTDNTLSKMGRLIVESRLDVMDGLSLIYALNISSLVFKAVFKIISICSFLKSGIFDLFYGDIEIEIKTKIIDKLIKDSDNSEHLLLYNLYKYIESNKDLGIFNLKLFDSIQNAYSRQIEKLESLYERFNIKLDEFKKKDLNTNIIKSLAYGYKTNRAFKSSQGFKYNDKVVDLSKCIIKPKSNYSSIFFYTNLTWSGKINIMICSPYLI
jgi:HrpA-like RNA helicase